MKPIYTIAFLLLALHIVYENFSPEAENRRNIDKHKIAIHRVFSDSWERDSKGKPKLDANSVNDALITALNYCGTVETSERENCVKAYQKLMREISQPKEDIRYPER